MAGGFGAPVTIGLLHRLGTEPGSFGNPVTLGLLHRLGALPLVVARRGGGTYLTQEELRRLRRELDAIEARAKRADREFNKELGETYEDIIRPERIRERIRAAQEADDEEAIIMILLHLDD